MDMDKGVIAALAASAGAIIAKFIDMLIARSKNISDESLVHRKMSVDEQALIMDQASKIRAELWEEIRLLRAEVRILENDVVSLREENTQLKIENAKLQIKVGELEEKLANTKKYLQKENAEKLEL